MKVDFKQTDQEIIISAEQMVLKRGKFAKYLDEVVKVVGLCSAFHGYIEVERESGTSFYAHYSHLTQQN